ncbi:Cloroperoxidase [Mollisia scopiformis]|uniref:Cloroperoxidase n=1 Tax=Mollisia scopiformis TaxID=149040 RepID=A0A194XUD5_MOLSC|nr:Cloroperoxidase [Mollisia scopiformis]KUJ23751.1 Cloroperoxidase [Mollisia scopiformis]
MKLSAISTTLAATLVSANPNYGRGSLDEWAPGGPDDFRGPCPMMNTLANHGFLPHDGGNITLENAVYALTTALNFNESVATLMWQQAIIANPEPNATFFTLDNLNRHNVLEHDASISRSDAFFGNNHVLNQTIFDTTTAFWTGDILDVTMLANGKMARQLASKAFNPNYTFTSTTEAFSLGEMGAPILIFGDIPAGTVNKTLVTYFFENERLPVELGWTKQASPINLDQVSATSASLSKAASLLTNSTTSAAARHRDLHAGFMFES